MPELIDEANGIIYHLNVGEKALVTIGKSDECTVIVPPRDNREQLLHDAEPYSDYDYVSRKHCAYNKTSKILFDFGSKNGTFVGDQPAGKEGLAVKDSDVVTLGKLKLTFYDAVE